MKISVQLSLNSPAHDPTVVEGEIVDIAPHLASLATWMVHRNPFSVANSWQVTNLETGYRCGEFRETKAAAIKDAKKRLSNVTERKMLCAYRKVPVSIRAGCATD